MRLLLRSLHGGIAATVFLFTLLWYLDGRTDLSELLHRALIWPWTLWKHLFPTDCFLCLRRIVVPLGTNVLLYSSLTYAILRLTGRRRVRTP